MQLPKDFIEKYQELLGDQAEAFLDSFDNQQMKSFRINPEKDYGQLNLNNPIAWSEFGYFGEISGNSPEHIAGAVYSQEASAQFVASVADIKEGDFVLDLAAAPGGKTTQLISQMGNQDLLISNEYVYKRAKILSQNVERFGGRNTIVTSNSAEKLAKVFENYFDKIILDAPCSGEGMFRKNPDAITYWSKEYPEQCAKLQKEILSSTISMLKPGGQLIYSTCTFAPEENEQIISWLLEKYPELSIANIDKSSSESIDDGRPEWSDNNPELLKTARFWPQTTKTEGHFIAKITKAFSKDAVPEYKELKSNLKKDALKIFEEFAISTFNNFELSNLYQVDNRLFKIPKNTPSVISELTIIRYGLELGEFKKRRFDPSHAIATGLEINLFKNVYQLNKDEFKDFVHGDVIKTDSQLTSGWYLITYQNNGIGLGKIADGQIKNHFPKGLRFSVNSD